jgi:3-methyladenine DNA glycosylase AlkD
MTESTALELHKRFVASSNPAKALEMARYMKNRFDFFGIQKPLRAVLEKPFIELLQYADFATIEMNVTTLWDIPQREMQYSAMELMLKSKIWQHKEAINLLENLIIRKSWWDTVDLLAGRFVGAYFLQYPEKRDEFIERWLKSTDMWLNRTAIIFQLNYKQRTDEGLLFHCAVHFSNSKEFFIQKAIGWALRQYARTAPDRVLQFVESHELKPLSRREALKHFPK